MKVTKTSRGRNVIEDMENEKELVVGSVTFEPYTDDTFTLELRFECGEEFAKVTFTEYEHQEKIPMWARFIERREYDELLNTVKEIAKTENIIDREAKIARFVSAVFEKYKRDC